MTEKAPSPLDREPHLPLVVRLQVTPSASDLFAAADLLEELVADRRMNEPRKRFPTSNARVLRVVAFLRENADECADLEDMEARR